MSVLPSLAHDFEYQDIWYTVLDADAKTCETKAGTRNDLGYTISGNNCEGDITIPSIVSDGTDNYTVTAIGEESFFDCSELTSIILPESIISIGSRAFHGCENLISINIPEGVTSIESYVFYNCYNLPSLTLPDRVTSIGTCAFYGCLNLTSINIPAGVTVIEDYTFSSCISLPSITLPAGLTSIGRSAFSACESLTSLTIPEGATSIGEHAFGSCTSMTSINIPERVTSIEMRTFDGCSSLTSINIPEGVTSIGDNAFQECTSLTSINIPDGVTSFGKCVFEGCSSLTSIQIPERWTSIGNDAFIGCSGLTSINIPEGVTSIGERAFSGCSNLPSINLPEGVTSIGRNAFFGCSSLTSINLPEGVTVIEDYTFNSCSSLPSIILPSGVTSIGRNAFSGCSNLSSIDIPSGVTSIGGGAFSECLSITSIDIPETVTTIGTWTFLNCENLTSITLPAGLQEIGAYSFFNCFNLVSITYNASNPIEAPSIFDYSYDIATLYMPNATLEAVQATEPWNKFKHIIAKDGSIIPVPSTGEHFEVDGIWYTVIDAEAKTVKTKDGEDGSNPGNQYEGDLTIPSIISLDNNDYTVVEIGHHSFCSLSGLTAVRLPSTVKKLGEASFYNCENLAYVELPSSLSEIEGFVFDSCVALTSITLPDGVEYVGERMFAHCKVLQSVTLPNSIKEIRGWAFGETAISSITLPESLEIIGGEAFAGCASLATIIFNNSLKTIEDRVFSGCAFTSIVLPESLETIGGGAFYHCVDLESIELPASLTRIGNNAFGEADNHLNYVTYNAEVPIEAESNIFLNREDFYETAYLTMPNATLANVQSITPWNLFKHIVASDGSVGGGLAEGDDFEYEGIWYTVIDSEAKTVKTKAGYFDTETNSNVPGNNCLGEVIIPSNVSDGTMDYTVTAIGYMGFSSCSELTSIMLPESVISIEESAFSYCSSLTSINIPEGVTTIEYATFWDCSSLTSISIPNVTSIGDGAFCRCSNLTSIYIPEGVASIGLWTFMYCSSLTSINLPESVTTLSNNAFCGCSSLTSINIPVGVTSIGEGAFSGCSSLNSINIPAAVSSIGESAFKSCDKLEEITYMASTPIEANENVFGSSTYDAATLLTPNATLASIQVTVPWNKFSRITASDGSIKPALCAGDDFEYEGIWYTVLDADAKTCETKAGVLVDPSSVGANIIEGDQVIPQTVTDGADQYTVVSIGNHSFAHSEGLTSLSLPESIAEIGTTAFMDCSALQSINMPEGLNIIKDSAFLRCISLTSVVVPQSVTVLESGAFDGCSSLVSATLPEALTSIRTLLFCNCSSLESITIPDGVTSIGSQAFLHCENLQSLDLPQAITSIGSRAFEGCLRLTSLNLPENLTTLQNSVFYGCSCLTTLNLPEALEVIEVNAFNRCSGLISLIIPESVKQIKTYSFKDCSSLKSVSLPSNLESIDEAFIGCPLETVNYSATIPIEASETVFDDSTYQSATLNTPNATLESVQATVPWNKFLRITASDGSIEPSLSANDEFVYNGMTYTIIDAEARTCKTKDSWYENAGELPEDFFAGDFEIPATVSDGSNNYTVVEIGLHTFDLCEPLTSIILPETLKTIDIYAFESCHNLVSVNIPASVDSIGYRAFADCSKLESISIPESMISLASSVFSGCRLLAEVHLPDAMTSIGDYCFNDCNALSSINFPSSLSEIKDGAFSTCGSLTSVTLPEGLLSVGSSAFASCHSLSQLSLPESLISIGYHGFWGCDMASLTLPASLTSIGEGAFERCEKIRVINYNATSPIIAPENIFDTEVIDIYNVATLNTPNASLEAVQATVPWNKFLRITASNGSIEPEVKVESITISQTTAQLKVGESLTLSATVLPEDATNTPITWISSNTEIATVDTEGNVTAIALGEATITATCGEATATCTISVVATPVESITLSQTSARLKVGESLTLSATVLPEDATDTTITWTSSDPEIASVDNEGNVTATALGEATITATCGEVTATCSLSVVSTPVESITLSQTSVQLKIGESATLSATVLPEDATDKTVTWTSSNTEIATVDTDGNVTAIALGEATITATCGEATATCTISVVSTPVESITLSNTSAELQVGESITLSATVLPEDATDKTVTWTSSNSEIASVDNDGLVTAIAAGEATITASCGEVTATCTITVTSNALSAGGDFEYEGVIYTVIDADAMTCRTKTGHYEDHTLIPGNNFEGDLVIPAVAVYSNFEYTVVEIGRYGFGFNAGLTSVIIPETITNIPESAFENCTNLTSATIPESVTSIGIYAFDECENLMSVDLPKNLKSMGYAAYRKCSSITSIVIPESLTVLENHVFESCNNLKTIDIPASITQIDSYAFYGCNNYAEITYRAEVPIEAPQDIFNEGTYQYGTLITPNATLESVQATVPWNKFVRISASDASTFIPNEGDSFTHEGIVYTIIDQENHTLKTADGSSEGEGGNNVEGDLVIPSSIEAYDAVYDITEIGAYSFAGSSFLTSVTIPSTIEKIGEGAFADCERLTSIIWEGHRQLPNEVIEGIGNPNLLIYVDSIQFAPAGIDHNIVVLKTNDGVPTCENLVLIQGYAFRPSIDFISQNSSLTQNFTQATIIGECAGWESLVLPFDVKSIYNDKCGELTPFAALTDIETQYPFWLYEADEQGEWKEADDIRAGIPHILSMPNNPDYLDRFNIDGPVKFACPEPTMITREIASPYSVNWASSQAFCSLWLPLDEQQAANAMGLNVGISGMTDDNGDELLPGSAFCDGVTPRPLEAYVTRQGAESAKRIIGTQSGVRTVNSLNGLEIKAYIGKIIITSDYDRKIDIFAIDGTHIRSLIVKAGTTKIVRDLTKGLYLVAGQKILVK